MKLIKFSLDPGVGACPAILIVCPPPIVEATVSGFPDFADGGIERSLLLPGEFRRVVREKKRCLKSEQVDLSLLIAGEIDGVASSPIDGIHLTADAHKNLGLAIAGEARRILGI